MDPSRTIFRLGGRKILALHVIVQSFQRLVFDFVEYPGPSHPVSSSFQDIWRLAKRR
jgi:hypothetical protein